jgi:hypothetical protein
MATSKSIKGTFANGVSFEIVCMTTLGKNAQIVADNYFTLRDIESVSKAFVGYHSLVGKYPKKGSKIEMEDNCLIEVNYCIIQPFASSIYYEITII